MLFPWKNPSRNCFAVQTLCLAPCSCLAMLFPPTRLYLPSQVVVVAVVVAAVGTEYFCSYDYVTLSTLGLSNTTTRHWFAVYVLCVLLVVKSGEGRLSLRFPSWLRFFPVHVPLKGAASSCKCLRIWWHRPGRSRRYHLGRTPESGRLQNEQICPRGKWTQGVGENVRPKDRRPVTGAEK